MANNYLDMPVEKRLTAEFPEASGAIKTALATGVSEDRIRDLMEDTYGNYEYEDARNALAEEVRQRKMGRKVDLKTGGLPSPWQETESGEAPTERERAQNQRVAPAKDGWPVEQNVRNLARDDGRFAVRGGAVLTTPSGRKTSPAPKFNDTTPATRKRSLAEQEKWLLAEAIAEADAAPWGSPTRNALPFLRGMKPGNMSMSDHYTVNDVLFGDMNGPQDAASWKTDRPPSKPVKAPKPKPQAAIAPVEVESGVLGPIFPGFTNQPEQAIAKLMAEKRGEVADAYLHPELGPIAFVYGDEKMGLRHIEAKRGISWVNRIPGILRKGTLRRDPSLPRAYIIDEASNGATVIRLEWDGAAKIWLVTALPAEYVGGASKTSGTAEPSEPVQGKPLSAQPAEDIVAQSDAQSKFAKNKLFTADKVEAARARLRDKVNRLNSGVDPEMLIDGMTIAGAYIEAGIRNFAEFAKAMRDEFGKPITPYLLSFWEGARNYPGLDTTGMTPPDVSAAMHQMMLAEAPQATSEPEPAMPKSENDDAGTSIYGDGPEPLAPMAANDGEGNAGSRDAQPLRPAGQQGSRAAGGEVDGSRPAKTRGGRVRPARTDPALAGAGDRVGPPRQASQPAAAPELKSEGGKSLTSPSETIERGSPGNVPAADFVITDELELGRGSETVKYQDNIAAIETHKKIEAENRRASAAEQRVLARYVGWGGLKNAFRVAGSKDGAGIAKGWEKRVAELEELLTPAELKAARNSTTAAHYTSHTVVQAMWKAAERLGFKGGAVLEPSVGTGNFLGLMPEGLRGASRIFAVEYDSLAGVREREARRAITVEGKVYGNREEAMAAVDAAIAAIRAGDEKARFKIEVAGEPVTTQDQINDAMRLRGIAPHQGGAEPDLGLSFPSAAGAWSDVPGRLRTGPDG